MPNTGAEKNYGMAAATPDVEKLRRKQNWSAQSGVGLIILGLIALGAISFAGPASNLLLAWLILVSGIAEAALAFHLRRSDGFFLHLVPAIAGVPVGLFMTVHPAADARTWMLMFASYFTVVGVFRAIAAYWLKFPNWRWGVFDGVVTVTLAAVLWPAPLWMATWFPGLSVAVCLILRGFSSVMIAVGFRSARKSNQSHSRLSEPQARVQGPGHLSSVGATDRY
jgi:uncharacterized membrane protein HdeD (DUF308 family)